MTGWNALQIIFGYLIVAISCACVGYFVGKEVVEKKLEEIQQINEQVKAEAKRQKSIKQLSGG